MIQPMPRSERKNYSAPALEKGLDVLEVLAEARAPMTTQAIAGALSRSRSEIFRMVSVLEDRGFIGRTGSEDGFALTPKLLELAMRNPPTRRLLDAALPSMERLAEATGQSCHLAVASGADMVVIARIESSEEVGFAVRIGHRRSLVESTSGRVLLANQPADVQRAWLARVPRPLVANRAELTRDLERIRSQGYRREKSSYVTGIVDIGSPVFDGRSTGAIAALTIPCVQKRENPPALGDVTDLLQRAAREISATLAARAGLGVRLLQAAS
jgi:DNA-binding IclR family transcriptional regulator